MKTISKKQQRPTLVPFASWFSKNNQAKWAKVCLPETQASYLRAAKIWANPSLLQKSGMTCQ